MEVQHFLLFGVLLWNAGPFAWGREGSKSTRRWMESQGITDVAAVHSEGAWMPKWMEMHSCPWNEMIKKPLAYIVCEPRLCVQCFDPSCCGSYFHPSGDAETMYGVVTQSKNLVQLRRQTFSRTFLPRLFFPIVLIWWPYIILTEETEAGLSWPSHQGLFTQSNPANHKKTTQIKLLVISDFWERLLIARSFISILFSVKVFNNKIFNIRRPPRSRKTKRRLFTPAFRRRYLIRLQVESFQHRCERNQEARSVKIWTLRPHVKFSLQCERRHVDWKAA